jgi:hypothetical protein
MPAKRIRRACLCDGGPWLRNIRRSRSRGNVADGDRGRAVRDLWLRSPRARGDRATPHRGRSPTRDARRDRDSGGDVGDRPRRRLHAARPDRRRRGHSRRRPASECSATSPGVSRRGEQPSPCHAADRSDRTDQQSDPRDPTATAAGRDRALAQPDGWVGEELLLGVDAEALARGTPHRSPGPAPRSALARCTARRDFGPAIEAAADHACDRTPGGEIRGVRPRARGWASPRRRPFNRRPAALGARPMSGGVGHRSVPISAPTGRRRSDTRGPTSSRMSRSRKRARCPTLQYFSCDQPVRRQNSRPLSPATCDASASRWSAVS